MLGLSLAIGAIRRQVLDEDEQPVDGGNLTVMGSVVLIFTPGSHRSEVTRSAKKLHARPSGQ